MAEGGNKITDEKIYSLLQALQVPVHKNELKAPTKEFMVRVFEHFLRAQCYDITNPALRTWESINHIDEMDIYEEPLFLVQLAMTVQMIIHQSGISISIKDIVDPKPKRTKKILYYILVYWNNYMQNFLHFRNLEKTFEPVKRNAEELILKNQCLKEEYEKKCEKLKNMNPNKAELQSIVAAKQEVMKLNEKQSQITNEEYADLKKKLNTIIGQISEYEVAVATAKERLEELGQLILSSPERLSTEVQRLKDKIRFEDAKIKEKAAQCKDNEKKVQVTEEKLKRNEKSLISLKNMLGEIQKFVEILKSLKIGQQKIDDDEAEVKRLQTEFQKKEDRKIHQHQKLYKLALNNKMEVKNLTALLETYKKEETRLKESLELVKAAVSANQESIDKEDEKIMYIHAKVNEYNSINRERAALYNARIENIGKEFADDYKFLSEKIKEKFPCI